MSESNPILVPHLAIKSRGESVRIHLEDDSTVLIGSGEHCKIQLQGDGIRSLHCIVAVKEGGRVEIRDWNTGCTFVNSVAIGETVALNDGDRIKIASHEILVVFPDPTVVAAAASFADDEQTEEEAAEPQVQVQTTIGATEEVAPVQEESVPVEQSNPVAEVDLYDDVEEEVSGEDAPAIPETFVYDAGTDFKDDVAVAQYDNDASEVEASGFSSGFTQQEELQRLQMENEQLRFELNQAAPSEDNSGEFLDRTGANRMVARMGDLLEELKQSDERTKELEELLESADQATRDEREERMLLAGVVAEFESRAEERQSKADAELVEMKQKLEDDWEQRSEEQSNTGAPVEMLVTMKNQIELLLGRLTQSQDEVASLKVQLEQQETQLEEQKTQLEENQAEVVDSGSDDEEEAERKTLAQMQLEIARERAEIARERAEVEELKAQQESKSEPREVSEADSRIMAMRDHLREIHDKEAIEKANQPEPEENTGSITSRLTSLLQQVTSE